MLKQIFNNLKTEQGDFSRPACRRNSLDQNPCLTPGGFCSRVGHAVAVAMGDNQFFQKKKKLNEYFEKKINLILGGKFGWDAIYLGYTVDGWMDSHYDS